MLKKKRSKKAQQIKKLVDEIVSYVHSDLFQRNASRIIPSLSRSNLFVKPENWPELFRQDGAAPNQDGRNGSANGTAQRAEISLETVIARAQESLLDRQDADGGYWYTPLRADTTLESDTITLYAYMGW